MASSAFIPKIAILPFTKEKISARAYSIFLREGSVDGSERNWFRAIKKLLAETEIKVDESPDTPPIPTGRGPCYGISITMICEVRQPLLSE
jgi:hypothetical protein